MPLNSTKHFVQYSEFASSLLIVMKEATDNFVEHIYLTDVKLQKLNG